MWIGAEVGEAWCVVRGAELGYALGVSMCISFSCI